MKNPSEVDALFALPLAEFVAARNALAARLKKEKRAEEGQQVKALVKPSATAWAVNQLYWGHRDDFDQLVAVSERVRQAQSGRGGDLRSLVDERRAMVSALASVAAELLSEAGHAASGDTRRRVITTLESLAAHDKSGIERQAGRLTADLEPLGFDSLAELLEAGLPTAKVLDFKQGADGKQRAKEKQREIEKQRAEAERVARARMEAERAARAEALRKAEAALAAARREAVHAEAAAAKAVARREALEQEKREIEARHVAAIADENAAVDEVEQTARALAEAEQAVAAAARAHSDSLA